MLILTSIAKYSRSWTREVYRRRQVQAPIRQRPEPQPLTEAGTSLPAFGCRSRGRAASSLNPPARFRSPGDRAPPPRPGARAGALRFLLRPSNLPDLPGFRPPRRRGCRPSRLSASASLGLGASALFNRFVVDRRSGGRFPRLRTGMLGPPSFGFGLLLRELLALEILNDGIALPFAAGDLVMVRIDVDLFAHFHSTGGRFVPRSPSRRSLALPA